ncbi:DUF1800 domain-containing protein [Fuerstiella marisgermanici]|uniref:DUF1800 domain-containing protein n=1 Tax=Fuerstiella marisgermanici TaxID=1891926 RepID=A0A1P8WP96_9PLAN|nr:DUF1800 domain-containing protein [Fuerstiella marisgermanici]APZ95868.1 hypothetical protein Fuma_05531 [Fuerstiella marisgermanici]
MPSTSAILNRWKPSADEPWNFQRVWHLHRRAGFGGTWAELQRDLTDGVGASVDRFLAGESHSVGVPAEFGEMADTIGHAAMTSANIDRLKAWWIYRIIFSPDPLTERLTLMWHNHFATSNVKVDDVEMMWRQNLLFRKHASGAFGDLLTSVVKDPAMLVWLDAAANRKEHPNENLARELMELFTLGEGHYTEDDVKNAAKCVTGWTVSRRAFRDHVQHHDVSQKAVLGKTGAFTGDDLLGILLSRPETSQRIAWRLCDTFLGASVATSDVIDQLAAGLRDHELDIRGAVETILRSNLFFFQKNISTRVAAPVDFVVGSVRALELVDKPPSTLLLAESIDRLGQELFSPPNVFGWKGGRRWINARSMIGRGKFAAALLAGELHYSPLPDDAFQLAKRHTGTNDATETAEFLSKLLLGNGKEPSRTDSLKTTREEEVRRFVGRMLASPESQLC